MAHDDFISVHRRIPMLSAVTLLLVAGAVASGETVIVTTLNDAVDFGGAQMIADLPGPDGKVSFREALIAVNNTPGEHAIGFNIPPDEWWLYNDRAILRLESGVFLLTRDNTIIDGTTQTDFTGDTNPNGWEVGIYGLQPNGWGSPAIVINADNCTVMGFDRVMQRGYAIDIRGHDNRVINNTISGPIHAAVRITGGFGGPPATGNIIGGAEPGEGNILSGGGSGVRIENPAEDNIVIGNRISGGDIGVWIIGSQYTDHVRNNRVGGPTPEERNIIAGAGSYCCEGAPSGAQIKLEYAENNLIEGNYIGLTPDGMNGQGQIGPRGIDLLHSPQNTIRNNIIGDIKAVGVNHYAGQLFGHGIFIRGASPGNIVQGNTLGLAIDGQTPLPNYRGIAISPFQGDPVDQLIGGVEPGQGNTIAHSDLAAIYVTIVTGVTISGNAIFSNGDLGIILSGGGNGNQPAPTIDEATASGSMLTATGTLNGTAGQTYRIELFTNNACDPTGFGEGQTFVGYADITATGSSTPFEITLEGGIEKGQLLTATATHLALGNTSEFSACTTIDIVPANPGDLNNDGVVDGADLLILLGAWGPCKDCDNCDADFDNNCAVDGTDLLALLAHWG